MDSSSALRGDAAKRRYSHAQDHFKLLQQQLLEAEDIENFEIQPASDGSGAKIFRVKNPPPVLLSLTLGDAIHSLRSALDYVTCALVTLNNPNADLSHVYFPFGSKGKRLDSGQKKYIESISDEVTEAIERMRAQYGEGLSLLREFSNQDKHRLLIPAYSYSKRFKFVVDQNEGKADLRPVDEGIVPIQDGSRIDVSNGSIMQPRIGFLLERGDVSYGSEHINNMNDAVRHTLNALLPLTKSPEPTQGVHP